MSKNFKKKIKFSNVFVCLVLTTIFITTFHFSPVLAKDSNKAAVVITQEDNQKKRIKNGRKELRKQYKKQIREAQENYLAVKKSAKAELKNQLESTSTKEEELQAKKKYELSVKEAEITMNNVKDEAAKNYKLAIS